MLDPLKSGQHSPSGVQEKGKTTKPIVADQVDGRRREEQFFIIRQEPQTSEEYPLSTRHFLGDSEWRWEAISF
jgi:hypothetical protein